MNADVAKILEQLIMLGADFQLTYQDSSFRPWSLIVRDSQTPARYEPISTVCLSVDLYWSAAFCANTVIKVTGAILPQHPISVR